MGGASTAIACPRVPWLFAFVWVELFLCPRATAVLQFTYTLVPTDRATYGCKAKRRGAAQTSVGVPHKATAGAGQWPQAQRCADSGCVPRGQAGCYRSAAAVARPHHPRAAVARPHRPRAAAVHPLRQGPAASKCKHTLWRALNSTEMTGSRRDSTAATAAAATAAAAAGDTQRCTSYHRSCAPAVSAACLRRNLTLATNGVRAGKEAAARCCTQEAAARCCIAAASCCTVR